MPILVVDPPAVMVGERSGIQLVLESVARLPKRFGQITFEGRMMQPWLVSSIIWKTALKVSSTLHRPGRDRQQRYAHRSFRQYALHSTRNDPVVVGHTP
jgi:hypothetical protein